ncbi:MAG: hypothetical protein HON23_02035 [Rickettsiales bacterium]|jgi:hypothetical protein|nr:hypothetical protein [Rickettsiales bacterium]
MPKNKKYKGELASPIKIKKPPAPPTLLTHCIDEKERHQTQLNHYANETSLHVVKERLRKLDLLLDKNGIDKNDPDKWFKLSYELSCEHVPGFGDKSHKLNEPKKWTLKKKLKLLKDFQGVNQKFSSSNICSILAKKEEYNSYTPEALENQMSLMKKDPVIKTYFNIKDHFPEADFADDFLNTLLLAIEGKDRRQ